MFGKIGSNGSWISSVAVSDTCREKLPHLFLEPSFQNGVLFPNPSNEIVYYDFTIEESLDLKILIFFKDFSITFVGYIIKSFMILDYLF